ncbi:MAG: NADH-quinone oxidoreductase subunit M [Deltaproteobacteria bacterium]|nr:NADH-quinone oxidoreductase subunit M [Deltaproteobacteria bacterium]
MNSGIFTLLTLTLPILAVLIIYFIPRTALKTLYVIANVFFALDLLLALLLWYLYVPESSSLQLRYQYAWLPDFGISFSLGLDGLSLPLVLLTSFLTLLVGIHSRSVSTGLKGYLICVLLLQAAMLGAFLAMDALIFYMFWESMLVPMFFLIGVWGSSRRVYAAMKFFIYTAVGGLPLLAGILYLAYLCLQQQNQVSFAITDWYNLNLSPNEQVVLLAIFTFAFAIKIPAFPLHTWLPDAHVEAPAGASVILAGVLLKLGLYGLIRFCLPIFTEAFAGYAWVLVILATLGIVYGAFMAWVQKDMKKLIAYSSVSHLGFCLLGVASLTTEGVNGAILQMVNHGITTGALFFIVGALYERYHTRLIADYGGLAGTLPRLSMFTLIFTLGAIGLPLTNGFVGEFLIIVGAFEWQAVAGLVSVSGVILGAIYMLSWYRRCFYGTPANTLAQKNDFVLREYLVFIPLAILVFVLGVYPNLILSRTTATAESYLKDFDRVLQERKMP